MTEANLEYNGSISLDPEFLAAADILPFEQVDVYNITNGNRFTTYAIAGPKGAREVCINGAAAHLARPGDMVIICSYVSTTEEEARNWKPKLILMDSDNRMLL